MSGQNAGHPGVLGKEKTMVFRGYVAFLRDDEGMSWGQIVQEAKIPQVGRNGDTAARLRDTYRKKPDPEMFQLIERLYRDRRKERAARLRPRRENEMKNVEERAREFNQILFALRDGWQLPWSEINTGLGYVDKSGSGGGQSAYSRGGAKQITEERLQIARKFYTEVVKRSDQHDEDERKESELRLLNQEPAPSQPAESPAPSQPVVEMISQDSWDRIRADLLAIADRIRALGGTYLRGSDLPASLRAEFEALFASRHDRLVAFIEKELD